VVRVLRSGKVTVPRRLRDLFGVEDSDYVCLALVEVLKKDADGGWRCIFYVLLFFCLRFCIRLIRFKVLSRSLSIFSAVSSHFSKALFLEQALSSQTCQMPASPALGSEEAMVPITYASRGLWKRRLCALPK
jgi:hypothetical protein